MSFNKKFFTTGGIVAASGGGVTPFDPLQNFETVTYTGNGSTQKITGYIRKGAAFASSNSYIIAGNGLYESARGTNGTSVSFWMRSSGNNYETPIYTRTSSAAAGWHIRTSTGGNGINWAWQNSSGSVVFASGEETVTLTDGWHHIVAIWDGTTNTNGVKLYIDGSLFDELTANATLASQTFTLEPTLGNDRQSGGRGVAGLDQIRFFDKALSQSEVDTLEAETYASSTKSTTDIFGDGSGVALYELDEDTKDTGGVTGYIGSGGIFNGSSSEIDLPNLGLGGNTTRSVSLWVNPSVTPASRGVIFSYGSGSNGQAFALDIDSSNNLRLSYYNRDYGTSTTVPNNTWTNIVITYNGGAVETASNTKIYINGAPQTLSSLGGTYTGVANTSDSNYGMGYRTYTNSLYFQGKIDQVRIFDTVLDSTKVEQLADETYASSTKSTTDIFNDGSAVALYELDDDANDTGGVTGYIGAGGVFNGSSSYIDTNYTLPADSSYSISCWFNTSSTSQMAIYSDIDSNADSPKARIALRLMSSGKFGLIIGDGSSSWINESTSSSSYLDGDWHHIVQVVNGTSVKLYADGNTTPIADLTSTVSAGTAGERSIIFGRLGHYNGQYYNGQIDQVRIFDKALSSSEVTTLYGETSASATKSTTDIFDDGSGVALYELEGNANDSGRFGIGAIDSGQSAVFNGSSSKIVTSDIGAKTGDISISAWVYFNDISGTQPIVCRDLTTSTRRLQFRNNGGTINAYWFHSGGLSALNSNTSVVANQWYHVVTTWEDGVANKIYINGSLDATDSAITGTRSSLEYITIGYLEQSNVFLNGKIDQVRIYSSALSASDVEALASETNVPTANLAAHYKLDGDATDETTNYDGTWSGTEAYSDPAEYPTYNGTATNVSYAYDGTATNVSYAYDGTPTNVNFLGMAFQPDLVWIKDRDDSYSHQPYDSVRGATKKIHTNTTAAETTDTTGLTSFDSNGFTVSTNVGINTNNNEYVAWNFKAGGAAGTYNIDGTGHATLGAAGLSITGVNGNSPTFTGCSINTEAGFGIYEIDPNHAVSNQRTDFTHGLDSTPELVISKILDGSGGSWHTFTNIIDGSTDRGKLNTTDIFTDDTSNGVSIATSTEIRIEEAFTGDTSRLLFYAFHSVDGYQKVGSYTGTKISNDVSVTLGFQPRFMIIKRTDTSGYDWNIFDSVRDTVNPNQKYLEANTSDIEDTGRGINFNSDGFSVYGTSNSVNASGGTYIYLAIA